MGFVAIVRQCTYVYKTIRTKLLSNGLSKGAHRCNSESLPELPPSHSGNNPTALKGLRQSGAVVQMLRNPGLAEKAACRDSAVVVWRKGPDFRHEEGCV